jgi:hypothetical protein
MPDADALVESLPWVENGVPRPGTVARLCKSRKWIALVTGGELTKDEGALLFKINEQLKSIAWRVFIVPPANASKNLIARMHKAGVAPPTPIPEELLLKRAPWGWRLWFLLVGSCFSGLSFIVAFISGESGSKRSIIGLFLSFIGFAFSAYVGMGRHKARYLEEFRNNPRRNAQERWAEVLADRGWEKPGP